MNLSKIELFKQFNLWLTAWNKHDLEGVMAFMHTDISFENWDGKIVSGKDTLKKSWMPWFIHHDNFKFTQEDIFFDEQEQKMTFQWKLEWPSIENKFNGQNKVRRGVDILEFKDGKIFRKTTYSKIVVQIGSAVVNMHTV